METKKQLEAIQNFADKFNLKVKEFIQEDKRKKTKFILIKNNISISNQMDYNETNIFLLGILNAKKYNL
jgi:hypothetical protein